MSFISLLLGVVICSLAQPPERQKPPRCGPRAPFPAGNLDAFLCLLPACPSSAWKHALFLPSHVRAVCCVRGSGPTLAEPSAGRRVLLRRPAVLARPLPGPKNCGRPCSRLPRSLWDPFSRERNRVLRVRNASSMGTRCREVNTVFPRPGRRTWGPCHAPPVHQSLPSRDFGGTPAAQRGLREALGAVPMPLCPALGPRAPAVPAPPFPQKSPRLCAGGGA